MSVFEYFSKVLQITDSRW